VAASTDPRYLTPAEVAARLNLAKVEPVYAWIHSGALRAVNLSTGARPTWRISAEDLAAFLERRQAVPVTRTERRPKVKPRKVTAYF
jgi:excisionase family DNA binding protein